MYEGLKIYGSILLLSVILIALSYTDKSPYNCDIRWTNLGIQAYQGSNVSIRAPLYETKHTIIIEWIMNITITTTLNVKEPLLISYCGFWKTYFHFNVVILMVSYRLYGTTFTPMIILCYELPRPQNVHLLHKWWFVWCILERSAVTIGSCLIF